jgi:hypothetical protein
VWRQWVARLAHDCSNKEEGVSAPRARLASFTMLALIYGHEAKCRQEGRRAENRYDGGFKDTLKVADICIEHVSEVYRRWEAECTCAAPCHADVLLLPSPDGRRHSVLLEAV